ncbi:MAG: amidohydrolase family protein [Bacteroidetes bacterium]|nr:amidohydrolase family protein [Bacteroidota bacterium]
MRFIQADWVYPVSSAPIENGVVVLNDEGKIEDVLSRQASENLGDKIEKHSGILCPGFVNTHCHLELSHLKGKLSEKKGLPQFVKEILAGRESDSTTIQLAMKAADREMYSNGINLVGDISNLTDSIVTKTESQIQYYTFIELFDILSTKTKQAFEEGVRLRKKFTEAGLACSLVPHAPYTVTPELFAKINDDIFSSLSTLSIHNQETVSENMFFTDQAGKMFEVMSKVNPDLLSHPPKAESALKYILTFLNSFSKLLLVHNTYTTVDDIKYVLESRKSIYWTICANANLYIEDKLPPIDLLDSMGAKLTIGTDSYASNWSLSVLDELKAIQNAFPEISLEKLIRWATYNGAEALRQTDKFGSLDKGKSPGILLLSLMDNTDLKSGFKSVKRLA